MNTKKQEKPSRSVSLLDYYIPLLLVILTVAAYWGVHTYEYIHLDDIDTIVNNPWVSHGFGAGSIVWAFTTTDWGYWMPVSWLSLMLDVQFFGLNPGASHIINLLFHCVNIILLFFVLLKFTGLRWHSAAVAALFAIHPMNVESVAWIFSRKDLLCTLFWLLTMLSYLRFTRIRTVLHYLPIAVFFILGLMTKPTIVTLPFCLLLLDFWPLKRVTPNKFADLTGKPILQCLWEKVPLFILSCCTVAINLINASMDKTVDLASLSVAARISNALISYCGYLGKLILPIHLGIYYPHPFPNVAALWKIIAAMLFLAIISVIAVRLIKKTPYLFTGWLWYLGTLVPVIGLAQTGSQAMADRFVYVPALGIFILAVWGLRDLIVRIRIPAVFTSWFVASVIIVVLSIMTRQQQGFWRSSVPIFEHTLAVTQKNHLIHNNLGLVYYNSGQREKASLQYKMALSCNPTNESAWNNLGVYYADKDSVSAAAECFLKAISLKPAGYSAMANLAVLYENSHNDSLAIQYYKKILTHTPNDFLSLGNLGNVYLRQNSPDTALYYLKKASFIRPNSGQIQNALGSVFERKNEPRKALDHYMKAIECSPSAWQPYNNMGLLLMAMNQLPYAIKSFTEAIQRKPGNEMPFVNRGRAYTGLNKNDYAKADFKNALSMNPISIPANLHLAQLHEKLGNTDSAALHREIVSRMQNVK